MYIRKVVVFAGIFTALFSCRLQQNMPQYLQGATAENIEKQIVVPELTIQKNDLLAIQVYSDYLPKTDNPDILYNQPTPAGGNASTANISTTTSTSGGYLVDKNGNITYPRLGAIHAEGLTKEQLGDEIKRKLVSPVKLLENPTVIVRFQTYRIITVGEFGAPQVLTIPTEKINIFEAIAMSGGITEWGRKDKVKVIREQDGKREMGLIDLSSPNVFTSPYYFLKQNDILLVDAIPEKAKLRDEATTLSRTGFAMTIFSAITAVTSFIFLLTRKN